MKSASFITCFILYALCGYCQQLQQVAHCPSNEVYDMLLDKKGFIWIAHNLGVSRYDGINFTNFSSPDETSISMTDLVEDNYGRIWCHNFNGQIFYIKDDKMVCLKEYDYKKEHVFPRMVLYNNELVVTTSNGLFICNTASLKCHYIDVHTGFYDLCVIKNSILIHDGYHVWHTYQTNRGLHFLATKNLNFKLYSPQVLKLEPRVNKDTAFLINLLEGNLYGVTIVNDTLTPVFIKNVKSVVNTVTVVRNEVWVNTSQNSFSLYQKDTIHNYSITAMTTDRQGNKWYGSLTHGLLVSYKSPGWQNIKAGILNGSDFIRLISKTSNGFLLGSQFGLIFSGKAINKIELHKTYTIPFKLGTPDDVEPLFAENYLVEASKGLFVFNTLTSKTYLIDSIITTKHVAVNGRFAYLATSFGMAIKDMNDWGLTGCNLRVPSFSIANSLLTGNPIMDKMKLKVLKNLYRCRAIIFDSATNSLLASFTDGLQRIKDDKISYILYKNQPLYVSSMARYGNKIYAGTFNNGLFLINGYSVQKIANNSESPQNAIIKIKCCNNHIWVFRSDDIEILDAATEKFVEIYPFPTDVADITDVEEDSSNIYLAAHTGLFTIPASTKEEVVQANPSLLYMLVNNTDTIQHTDVSLPSNKNNLVFKLAIPVYKDADQLHFKYSLISDGDTSSAVWYYTQDAQRDIQFNALKPGSYTIEITAMQDDRLISTSPLVYHFFISKPWFNTWWFYTLVLLVAVSTGMTLYQYRLYQQVKIERMRRKISNDLHDDIGSTLSSINVYSQLAKGNYGNESYIDTIQNSAVSVISNLDDLVWNINPKNDVLSQLITRMQLFAETLLREKGIECIFKTKLTDKNFDVSPTARAHLYLLFKESINNIIKHSGCTQCSVFIVQKNKALRLTVKDNGRGFNIKTANQHRNGLRIMAERVKELKGDIHINSIPGEGTEIKIMCHLT